MNASYSPSRTPKWVPPVLVACMFIGLLSYLIAKC